MQEMGSLLHSLPGRIAGASREEAAQQLDETESCRDQHDVAPYIRFRPEKGKKLGKEDP